MATLISPQVRPDQVGEPPEPAGGVQARPRGGQPHPAAVPWTEAGGLRQDQRQGMPDWVWEMS